MDVIFYLRDIMPVQCEKKKKRKKNRMFWSALIINLDIYEKIKTDIIYSKNPEVEVARRNKKKKDRLGREPPPDQVWIIYMVIGPFDDMDSAKKFHDKWKDKTRGVQSRRETGTQLAAELGLKVFVSTNVKEFNDVIQLYRKYKKKSVLSNSNNGQKSTR
jgi:hypothetical protein